MTQKDLSKKLIIKALLQLMKEKPYDQINITELSSRAYLSRRTFYRHFNTIDDVLTYLLTSISTKFTDYILKQPKHDLETIIYNYFSYWEKQRDLLMLLKNNNLLYLLLQCFTPEIRERLYHLKEGDKLCINYAYYFTCGGIWCMLVNWLECDYKCSPDEMKKMAGTILKYIE